MTPLLWILFAVLVWNVVLTLVPVVAVSIKDPMFGTTNRDGEAPEMALWGQRAKRASENMKENLPLFLGMTVLVHLTDPGNATALMGAQVFFGARVLHGIVYIVGVPFIRTLIWLTSMVGVGMMASALF